MLYYFLTRNGRDGFQANYYLFMYCSFILSFVIIGTILGQCFLILLPGWIMLFPNVIVAASAVVILFSFLFLSG
jgi:hypothetical protein